MNPVRNSKSGLLALLAAGGLLAWRNRDKIQGWMNNRRSQLSEQFGSSQPATGPTRRFEQSDYPSMNDTPHTQNDPLNRDM